MLCIIAKITANGISDMNSILDGQGNFITLKNNTFNQDNFLLLFFNLDVIMDMLGNSKMREAILQYYEESGDPQAVFEAILESQETEDNIVDEGLADFMFGNRK